MPHYQFLSARNYIFFLTGTERFLSSKIVKIISLMMMGDLLHDSFYLKQIYLGVLSK